MLVTTTYLEQRSPEDVRDGRTPSDPVEIVRVEHPAPEFCRFLYATVGGDWHWTDRLGWSRERWLSYLARPMVETWVAWVRGAPAGYIELAGNGSSVEIAYFGLLPGFLGRGLGAHLLSRGLRLAWSMPERWSCAEPVSRVWVHTCTLDGPAALANYRARGLVIYREEETQQNVPDSPPGSWPPAGA